MTSYSRVYVVRPKYSSLVGGPLRPAQPLRGIETMQKINTLTSTISSIAMLALAALPMAALTTAAHAAPAAVRVADLNLASHEGRAEFNQRADYAARKFCNTEISLSARANCRVGVK
eukprot:gene4932-6539_t